MQSATTSLGRSCPTYGLCHDLGGNTFVARRVLVGDSNCFYPRRQCLPDSFWGADEKLPWIHERKIVHGKYGLSEQEALVADQSHCLSVRAELC